MCELKQVRCYNGKMTDRDMKNIKLFENYLQCGATNDQFFPLSFDLKHKAQQHQLSEK